DTARWSASSGGAGGQCPPTSVDHVIFDNNSFSSANDTVQGIPLHMYCNDMTWTATAFAPCFFSNATNQLHVYGSLTLQPDMHWAMLGTVLFEATSTGHTVDPAGNAFYGMVDFKGNGGGWTLLDSLIIIDQNLQHIRGHLNTAGHKVDCYRYYSHDPNIRELTLGATRMILRADIIEAFHLNASFFTLNAGTSEIVLAGRSPTFFAQNATSLDFYDLTFSCDSGRATFEKPGTAFHTVRFHSHGTVIGNTEMDSLVLSKGRNYTFQALTGQLIGTLVAPGTCIEPILIESDSIGALTTFSMGPDTSTVYDVQVTDISCVPDSLIRGFNSLDLGKTTGWAMQRRIGTDYYWIGGTGRWDDTLHWSNVSGGLPAGCLPSPVDDVFFDNNSFLSPKDTVDAGGRLIQCRDVSWIHSNSQPFFTGEDSATWRIYGSMLLSDSMQYNYRGVISFLADTTGKTLTTRGRVLLNTLLFQHPQGGWTLMDSLFMKCEDCALDLRQGRLVTRNRYLELPGLRSTRNLTRALDMRASVCHIGLLGWTMCTDSLSLWADSSHIIFDTSGVMLNFDGDTVIYHNLSFTSQNAFPLLITEQCIAVFNEVRFLSSASIAGENIYDTLYFSSGKNYYIEEDQTQHFQHLDAAGDCFNYIRILCIDNNKQTAFSKTSDTLRLDFVRLRGIKAGGGAVFEALNSLDDGDNLNWTIINPPSTDHYWVGGSGNWSDSSHWSYSSGGPGGACIPTRRDDVYFDASSFLPGQDTVTIDLLAECRSMDWSGAKGNPLLMGTWSLSLFGSLNLTDSMLNMLNAYWYFASDAPGNTIHTASQPFLRPVFFQGNGSWDLTDDFHCYAEIYHAKGRLNTQGHFVSASAYRSDFENPRVLDLGSSTLQLNSAQMISWVVDGTNMSILPGTSTIIFSQATGMENKTGSNLEYHNVVFANSSGSSLIRSNQIECRFNHVILHNGARIFGKNTFDSLTFFPDHT
ncbi:MAG TPA: hypothetical protein P5248_06240, partial [Bacteroidales bacterium]|nr:hypothetical protein [Bacteroidales bacterium]